MRLSSLARYGLMSLCLTPLLTACASRAVSTIVLAPPSALTQDCRQPSFTGSTNSDLANFALDQKQALQDCTDDKAAIRDWVNKNQPN